MTTDVIPGDEGGTHPLGVAFLGAGFMGRVHSRAARRAGARLAGAAASTPERGRAAAVELGVERGFESVDAVLADDAVDVVHVCTPNGTHAALAERVVAAGKHVVCEKPLATNGADARRVADAAAAAGVVATVPFVYRYHPMVREARARVARGDLGRLLSLSGSYLQDWLLSQADDDWRVDARIGGPSRAFADIGSHLVDLIEFVAGDRIVRLAATTRTVFPERATHRGITTEDLAALVVELGSGAVGTLLVSQVSPGRKNALVLELAGADESVRFEQEDPDRLWIGRRTENSLVVRDGAALTPDAARLSTVPGGHPMGYQDAFDSFVDDTYALVRGVEREGVPGFADGVRAVAITEAVLRSAAEGAWVDVPAPDVVTARRGAA